MLLLLIVKSNNAHKIPLFYYQELNIISYSIHHKKVKIIIKYAQL